MPQIPSMGLQARRPWRKVLYVDQGVPDNYVDESFLDEMKKNLYTRKYEFWSVVWESGVVSQQMSSICLFVAAFAYMDLGELSPSLLFCMMTVLTIVGCALFGAVEGRKTQAKTSREALWDARGTALAMVAVLFLSPVLKTLTISISTDTIYAMTTFMLLLNLVSHDYGPNAAIVSPTVSFNAAIFASVCLASRLPSAWHVFVMVCFAMQLFALFPALRRQMKVELHESHMVMTWSLVLVVIATLWPLSSLFAVLFLLAHLVVTFLCPYWLVNLQLQKNNIHGPWDEAVITQ